MSLRRYLSANRKAVADQSSLGKDGTPTSTYSSNVMAAPSHSLSGRDSVRQPDETESSLTDTIGIAKVATVTPDYIYYRIYAKDGGIPLKTPVTPGDPFLGRIQARSVPPPRTAKTVKRSIAKVENIKDRESTSLFLTPYSQPPMDDADKVIILNGTGPGSTPQEPLALVAKMSSSERSALESKRRGGLASAAEPDTTIKYLYYLLYADDYEMPSKVPIDPGEPSLGRIRADTVAPPHSPTSIKRCISRVEGNPALAWYADLFADTSCDTPLKEGHVSILPTDGPGLSPNEPMAIVLRPAIPDGKYVIKNRAKDIYWNSAGHNPITTVHFYYLTRMESAKRIDLLQWDITNENNGNISIKSVHAPSSWVGAEITGSTVPIPWLLIPADSKFHYLTTDVNHFSQNPRVPAAQDSKVEYSNPFASTATLKEGDQWQMWEFIPVYSD